jgi:hypothetical protein
MKKGSYFAALRVDLVNCLDGIQVIDARVDAHFVQDDDTCFLDLVLQGSHGRRNIAGSDDIRFALDGGLDHVCVMCVRHERDN